QSALMAVAAFAGSIAGGLLPPLCATLIGANLEQPAPYRYPLLLAACVMLPAILALRATPRESPVVADVPGTVAPGATAQLTIPSAVLAAIVMMGVVRLLQVTALASVSNFFNVYLDRGLDISTAQIGTITAFGRLLAAPAALATAGLSRRFGSVGVVTWSTLMSALAMLPLAIVPHWSAAGISLVMVVGFSSIRYASSLVYFLELVPPRRRATVAGVTEMAAGLSFTLVALLGGYLIAWYSYTLLFGLAAVLTVLGALVFWAYFRRLQPA
ncbi:MAG TPA: MFS transporter, partial [Roseiflexaceae bacterium]|nr:MFS transporter [Roseiflexaceae bacterium]